MEKTRYYAMKHPDGHLLRDTFDRHEPWCWALFYPRPHILPSQVPSASQVPSEFIEAKKLEGYHTVELMEVERGES